MNKKDQEKLEVGIGGKGWLLEYRILREKKTKKLYDHASNFQCQVKTILLFIIDFCQKN